ncbi:hypothetical protein BH23CHL2_BH23CHL2_19580 [soil metagenome]
MEAVTERFQPTEPFALPPELVGAIKDDEYACVTLATNRGTAIVAKLPGAEIEGLRGTFPIQVRHELFGHPASPVIRLTATLYDNPRSPFLLETFINIGELDQRADYAAFADQEKIPLLFFDEHHQHRLGKTVSNGSQAQIPLILQHADELLAGIPVEQRDFDRAKIDVMATIRLEGDGEGSDRPL